MQTFVSLSRTMESDIELMLRAKTGDDSAFTELMRRHYKGVVNYVYRFTNDRANSEDLAQEVFLRVYRSVKRYNPQAKFSTWLYKIATNLETWVKNEKHKNLWEVSILPLNLSLR